MSDNIARDLQDGIGASEIGAILGMNIYETPLTIYNNKVYGNNFSGNKFTEAGDMLEEAIIERALRDVNAKPYSAEDSAAAPRYGEEMFQHPEKPHIRCHLDCFSTYNVNGELFVIEAKNTQKNVALIEDVPAQWYYQIQYQMGILRALNYDISHGYLAILERGLDFRMHRIEFNPKAWELAEGSADEFWFEYILKKKAPPVLTASDVALVVKTSTAGGVKVCDGKEAKLIGQLYHAKWQIKEAKKLEEEIVDKLKVALFDNEKLISETGELLCSFKSTKPVKRFNAKKLLEENPEVHAQYAYEGAPNRPLRLIWKPVNKEDA